MSCLGSMPKAKFALTSLCLPQRLDMVKELTKLKVIHVAGTKGKVNDRACLVQSKALACCNLPHSSLSVLQGSTCAMVESMLQQCGYRTGLFTSPHLVDVRERIRLGGYVTPVSSNHKACIWVS